MKFLARALFVAFSSLAACGDSDPGSTTGRTAAENEVADVRRECACAFADFGYASEDACLADSLPTGAEIEGQADCIDAALADASEAVRASYACTTDGYRDLNTCVDAFACGAPTDGCPSEIDIMAECVCTGLTGDALTACQTEHDAFSTEFCY